MRIRSHLMSLLLLGTLLFLFAGCAGDDDDDNDHTDDDAADDDAADDDQTDDDALDDDAVDDDVVFDCSEYSRDLPDPEGVCDPGHESVLPAPTGPYCIGVTAPIHLIDSSRGEPFTPNDPDDKREMMIRIWYPTNQSTQGEPAMYMDESTFATLMAELGSIPVPDDLLEQIKPNGVAQAPFATGKKMFPVLIFSPGYGCTMFDYTAFYENLASHGYVVAAVNHPYTTMITVFPDGREVPLYETQDIEALNRAHQLIVDDMLFVLDYLEQSNVAPDNPFACRLDMERVGMFGHSYGGSASATAAAQDMRVLAAMDIDGSIFGDPAITALNKPFMFMLSEEHIFALDPSIGDLWDGLGADGYAVRVTDSQHLSYADYSLLIHYIMPDVPDLLLNYFDLGTIDPYRMMEIAGESQRAFFDVYLKDAAFDQLFELVFKYSEVIFDSKP